MIPLQLSSGVRQQQGFDSHMLTRRHWARRLAAGSAPVLIGLGCARNAGQPSTVAAAPREVRISRDYGLGGPGPGLLVATGPGGQVRGAAFVRARAPIPGLPDSVAALLRAEEEARFSQVGCSEPVELRFTRACAVRFGDQEPDWRAVSRAVDAALAADSVAERADAAARRPAVQADGTIRIRGCNDCDGVFAEIRETSGVRGWRLGPEAGAQLGRLVDSRVARAVHGRR